MADIDLHEVVSGLFAILALLLAWMWKDLKTQTDKIDERTGQMREVYVRRQDVIDLASAIEKAKADIADLREKKIGRDELSERFAQFENTVIKASNDVRDSVARLHARMDKLDDANREDFKTLLSEMGREGRRAPI